MKNWSGSMMTMTDSFTCGELASQCASPMGLLIHGNSRAPSNEGVTWRKKLGCDDFWSSSSGTVSSARPSGCVRNLACARFTCSVSQPDTTREILPGCPDA